MIRLMHLNQRIFTLLISGLTVFLLEGCYTQLAVTKRVYVREDPRYRMADEYNSAELPDSLGAEEALQDTIVYEHQDWWWNPWYDHPFFCEDPGFYMGFNFTWRDPWWGDPWWYPGPYYRYRPYWSRFYYTGWYGSGLYWGDPWGFGPYYDYYTALDYPYWGWYRSIYAVDRRPFQKREWDRRGAERSDRRIVRGENYNPVQGPSPKDLQAPPAEPAGRSGSYAHVVRRGEAEKTAGKTTSPRSTTRRKPGLDIRRNRDLDNHRYQRVSRPGPRVVKRTGRNFSPFPLSVKPHRSGSRRTGESSVTRSSASSSKSGASRSGRTVSRTGGSRSSNSGAKATQSRAGSKSGASRSGRTVSRTGSSRSSNSGSKATQSRGGRKGSSRGRSQK